MTMHAQMPECRMFAFILHLCVFSIYLTICKQQYYRNICIMKKLLLVFSCLLMVSVGFSQQQPQQEKRGYIGFSIGPAFPLGEFASADINGDYSGYAKTGLSLQLVNFGYRFGKYVGLAGLWSGSSFMVDNITLNNDAALGSGLLESDPWGFGAFMGGVLVSIPQRVLDIDFRLMMGYGYGMSPEMFVRQYSGFSYTTYRQESGDAGTLAWDLGVGMRIKLSRLISLNILMDYMSGSFDFAVGMYEDGVFMGTYEFSQPMNHLTLTGGIGFRLN